MKNNSHIYVNSSRGKVLKQPKQTVRLTNRLQASSQREVERKLSPQFSCVQLYTEAPLFTRKVV